MVVALAGGIGQLRPEEAGVTWFSAWSTTNRTGPLIYTNENRTIITPDANPVGVAGTRTRSSGKAYFEVTFQNPDWGYGRQSMGATSALPWNPNWPIGGQVAAEAGMVSMWDENPATPGIWHGMWRLRTVGWDTGWGITAADYNDILGVAIDFNFSGLYVVGYFHLNGVWQAGGTGFTPVFNPSAVDYNFGTTGVSVLPLCSVCNYGTATLNVGNEPFRFAPPGFDPWG